MANYYTRPNRAYQQAYQNARRTYEAHVKGTDEAYGDEGTRAAYSTAMNALQKAYLTEAKRLLELSHTGVEYAAELFALTYPQADRTGKTAFTLAHTDLLLEGAEDRKGTAEIHAYQLIDQLKHHVDHVEAKGKIADKDKLVLEDARTALNTPGLWNNVIDLATVYLGANPLGRHGSGTDPRELVNQ